MIAHIPQTNPMPKGNRNLYVHDADGDYMQKIYDFKAFSSKGKEIGLKAKAAKTLFKAISKSVEII